VQIDWIHHSDDGSGTLNLCFNALDRHVVRGRADAPAIAADRPTSYARLVEEVAAFGGVLRAFGIGLGDPVVARLPPGRDALVALLASTRLGAVHVLEEPTSLNTLELLPELLRAGIASVKIEGRQRSPAYVADVARVWRQAIDRCKAQPEQFEVAPQWMQTLGDLSEGSQTTLGAYHREWQ